MRIGLYGLPTSGKSFILDRVENFNVFSGSSLLQAIAPNFHSLSDSEKAEARKTLARTLNGQESFIMDGHYAFGDKVVFTEEDGLLYDVFLYLYVNPKILKERMRNSERNNKYLEFDIEKWQKNEVESLRAYCHEHNKDFYVLDEPLEGAFLDISPVLEFIDRIAGGFSCVQYAKQITERILRDYSGDEVTLFDGDKTLIFEDSCGLIGYKTHLFDGNFYSGFQFFRHHKAMADYTNRRSDDVELHINQKVIHQIRGRAFILTSGYPGIWNRISEKLHMSIYCGEQMSADTKYFVTKFLQQAGIRVTAFGDSMNDYYMLKQADESHLILRQDGTVSTSLKERNLEGITIG